MSMQHLKSLLAEQGEFARKSPAFAAARERDSWIQAVETLIANIKLWFSDNEESGSVKLEEHTRELEEPRIGKYSINALWIVTPIGQAVMVEPLGRYVGGREVSGLVEMRGFERAVTIFRGNDGQWYFVGTPSVEPINPDTFAKYFLRLIGVAP